MPAFSKRERLSPVDAAWFHMDTPTNMAMITGVMMFSDAAGHLAAQTSGGISSVAA